jgi:SAM-dependent methyltransferase
MQRSVFDFKVFYNGKIGRMVRRVMQNRIRQFWPDVKDMRVLGCGYAVPYLRVFKDEAERTIAVMPKSQGVHHWPQHAHEKNMVCLSEESALPFESSSMDRIILIHDLEFSERLSANLQEYWRVLKANGRLLVVVPRRSGAWARAEWSPFGVGTPYSHSQICFHLRDNGFIHERTEEALFLPPLRFDPLLKFAGLLERFGRPFVPFLSGLYMVEASKQVFATLDKGAGSPVRIHGRGGLVQALPQSYSPLERE